MISKAKSTHVCAHTHTHPLFAYSIPQCLKEPQLGQAETKSCALSTGISDQAQGHNRLSHPWLFSRAFISRKQSYRHSKDPSAGTAVRGTGGPCDILNTTLNAFSLISISATRLDIKISRSYG